MFQLPKIMGVLNVTPDSFSDGGQFESAELAVKQALRLIDEGADILDIGGESTRPGAQDIDVAEEIRRTVPVIKALREATRDFDDDPVISIDTRKPEVAEAAILAGADIWNDVSALGFSAHSPSVAAELGCPVILMHAQGSPETMQDDPHYENVIYEVKKFLEQRIFTAISAGVESDKIIIDPGIGFGKRLEDNLALLRHFYSFHDLAQDMLIGVSRKSFIGSIDGSNADDRLGGSIAAALWCADAGADILRVHDVAETVQAVRVWQAIANGSTD